jgi:hypothetical protein
MSIDPSSQLLADSSGPSHPIPFPADDLFNAFAAVRHLHPKQLRLLEYLNSRRDTARPAQTLPLSYAHLHHATGITIEHIRRNGLHRLFASGLLSVVLQGLGGTVYRLHYSAPVLNQVLAKVTGAIEHRLTEPMPTTQSTTPQLHRELQDLEAHLSLLKQIQASRESVRRESFLAQLRPEQLQWLANIAQQTIDAQEGIRFVRDRFPLYEQERARLIDEWIARQAYGQAVPTSPLPTTRESQS